MFTRSASAFPAEHVHFPTPTPAKMRFCQLLLNLEMPSFPASRRVPQNLALCKGTYQQIYLCLTNSGLPIANLDVTRSLFRRHPGVIRAACNLLAAQQPPPAASTDFDEPPNLHQIKTMNEGDGSRIFSPVPVSFRLKHC